MKIDFATFNEMVEEVFGWDATRSSRVGMGNNFMSLSFCMNGLTMNFRFRQPRKNVIVDGWLSFPVNGLPLEENHIFLDSGKKYQGNKTLGKVNTLKDGLKFAKSTMRKANSISKKFAKEAQASNEAKGLWMMTI
jgi:hypothetical protein